MRIDVASIDLTPDMLKQRYVCFIYANIEYGSVGDAYYVDYAVERVTIRDRSGIPHTFWRITPIVTFTPLQVTRIIPGTLSDIEVRVGTVEYMNLYMQYSRLLGATGPSYKWFKYRLDGYVRETLDTTSKLERETSLAGAEIGIVQSLLKKLILTIVPGGEAMKKFKA